MPRREELFERKREVDPEVRLWDDSAISTVRDPLRSVARPICVICFWYGSLGKHFAAIDNDRLSSYEIALAGR